MLRLFVLLLVLLNGTYWAWSHGLLRAYGLAPLQQSEPQRLAQQLRPEALQPLTSEEVKRAEFVPTAVPLKPVECLQAGLFDDRQSATLRSTLEPALPAGSWRLEPVVEPARWIIYMGKFVTPEVMAKKRSELAALNLKFEPLRNPALELGLSLGGFATQDAASIALQQLNQRGVRTARVVQEQVELRGNLLKIPQADDTLRSRLDEFKSTLAGKPLQPCP
jgi:hypothetical protein